MTTSGRGIAWRWAEHVVGLRYDAIPNEAVERAKAILLHHLAIALSMGSTELARVALDLIRPDRGGATVIGQNLRAEPRDAVLANAVIMRSPRMEDALVPSGCHPGPTFISVALAVGESGVASGRDLLVALVVGYDILGRAAGRIVSSDVVGRPSHYVFGVIGTAAVAARLMRLEIDQVAGALAHASNLAVMAPEGFQDLQFGLISRNAMLAAELGRIRAPFPDDAFEGEYGFYATQLRGVRPSETELLGDLGVRFDIMRSMLKSHPCTGLNIIALELVRRALRENRLDGAAIRRIRVTRSRVVEKHPNANRKGPFDVRLGGPSHGYAAGKYIATTSLPFNIANLLLGREITPATFENPDASPACAQMDKVEIIFQDCADTLWTEVEIETQDGRKLAFEGGIENIPVPDMEAFLARYAVPVIGTERTERLRAAVEGLDSASDLSTLLAAIR